MPSPFLREACVLLFEPCGLWFTTALAPHYWAPVPIKNFAASVVHWFLWITVSLTRVQPPSGWKLCLTHRCFHEAESKCLLKEWKRRMPWSLAWLWPQRPSAPRVQWLSFQTALSSCLRSCVPNTQTAVYHRPRWVHCTRFRQISHFKASKMQLKLWIGGDRLAARSLWAATSGELAILLTRRGCLCNRHAPFRARLPPVDCELQEGKLGPAHVCLDPAEWVPGT